MGTILKGSQLPMDDRPHSLLARLRHPKHLDFSGRRLACPDSRHLYMSLIRESTTRTGGKRPPVRIGTATIAAAVLAAAGCGGKQVLYSSRETRNCLAGTRLLNVSRADADLIAQSAIGGGYLVDVGQTRVNVSFYRTSGDAKQELDAYKAFGGGGSRLYAKRNAVLAWDDTPTDAERSAVDGCLG